VSRLAVLDLDGGPTAPAGTAAATSDATGAAPAMRLARTRPEAPPDCTLLNLNLMLVRNDGTFDQQSYVPLGPLYLAAVLEREGWNVEFADFQQFAGNRAFDIDGLVAALRESAPVLGISVMSNLLPFAIECARRLKADRPERTLVLGGVGPSPVAAQIVEAFPFVDYVVEGEGERNLPDILRREQRPAHHNLTPRNPLPVPAVVDDLDTLPLPAYHLLDFSLYDAAPSVVTSRGCPYRCTFCTEPYNFSGKVRFRSVESVLEEIERVHALSGRTLFLFQDDILPMNRPRFRRLLEGFANLSFPIEWKCFSRVDLMSPDLMAEMVGAGCVQIRYGIESGSNETLARIIKGFEIEPAYEVAVESVRHFPSVHASFIWGYPGETVEQMEETLTWAERFEDAGVSVLLFEYAPLPGSPLYQQSAKDLVFSPDRYSMYVVTGHEELRGDDLRVSSQHDEVYRLVREHPTIFSGFYQYDGADKLAMMKSLSRFEARRRSRFRNEHDL